MLVCCVCAAVSWLFACHLARQQRFVDSGCNAACPWLQCSAGTTLVKLVDGSQKCVSVAARHTSCQFCLSCFWFHLGCTALAHGCTMCLRPLPIPAPDPCSAPPSLAARFTTPTAPATASAPPYATHSLAAAPAPAGAVPQAATSVAPRATAAILAQAPPASRAHALSTAAPPSHAFGTTRCASSPSSAAGCPPTLATSPAPAQAATLLARPSSALPSTAARATPAASSSAHPQRRAPSVPTSTRRPHPAELRAASSPLPPQVACPASHLPIGGSSTATLCVINHACCIPGCCSCSLQFDPGSSPLHNLLPLGLLLALRLRIKCPHGPQRIGIVYSCFPSCPSLTPT